MLVDTERLAVIVMPRKFWGGKSPRGWIFLHRFCAHIHVVDSLAGPGGADPKAEETK